MNVLEVSKRVIDAWKRHDAAEGHRFYWRLSIYVREGDDWKIRLSAVAEHPRNIAFWAAVIQSLSARNRSN